MALALTLGFAAIGGAWLAFRTDVGETARAGDGREIGSATVDLTMAGGDYYYLRVVNTHPWDSTMEDRSWSHESWWAVDDSGRINNLVGHDVDEASFDPGTFVSDTGDVSDLSTDPAQLEAQLRIRVEPDGASPEPYADWGGPVEWGLIRSIQELLESPDVPPAVKASLVQVAVNLNGVSVDDRAVDPEGRLGILLSTRTEQKLTEWWFDPTSLQLLASRETYDEDGAVSTLTVASAGIARSVETDHLVRAFVRPAD